MDTIKKNIISFYTMSIAYSGIAKLVVSDAHTHNMHWKDKHCYRRGIANSACIRIPIPYSEILILLRKKFPIAVEKYCRKKFPKYIIAHTSAVKPQLQKRAWFIKNEDSGLPPLSPLSITSRKVTCITMSAVIMH